MNYMMKMSALDVTVDILAESLGIVFPVIGKRIAYGVVIVDNFNNTYS